ncbi:hypothetical protein, partial [Sinomonas notoginsengisoli]|uniref:hypothetical protein n=1 Tax=Sinomonas notoginsengisoli TaxID=1457311 RepID=UPI0035569CFC
MHTLVRRAMLGTLVAGGLFGLGQVAASADATLPSADPHHGAAQPPAAINPLSVVTDPVLVVGAPTSVTVGGVGAANPTAQAVPGVVG